MHALGSEEQRPAQGPFSPSPFAGLSYAPDRFKGLPQSGITLPVDAVTGDRLREAFVNAAHIIEARAPAPRPAPAPAVAAPPETAAVLPVLDRPFAQRPAPRRDDLRLLPLESFVWGARTTPPQPRTRSDHVMIWVTAGALQLDFPRRRRVLTPGAVEFLPAGTGFATLPLGGARGHVLLIASALSRDVTPPLPNQPTGGILPEGAEAGLGATLTDLASESLAGGRQARDALRCHLGLLAVRLARLDPPPVRPALSVATPPDLPLVDRFLSLADAHLASGRTVGELAEMLGAPTAVLDRACVAARGRRAIELIHDLRHEKAVALLRAGKLGSTDIARELGYAGLAHFTRSFVARTGQLPEAFRP